MTYASVDNVGVELGRTLVSPEREQIEQWLERVERIIKSRIPDLAHRVAVGTLDEGVVADIEIASVTRKALNPQGLRSISRSVDDGTLQQTIDNSQSDGVLRLLDAEWDLLLPAATSETFSSPVSFVPGWRQ